MTRNTWNIEAIQITPDLLALLSEIDEFKGAWRALGADGKMIGNKKRDCAV